MQKLLCLRVVFKFFAGIFIISFVSKPVFARDVSISFETSTKNKTDFYLQENDLVHFKVKARAGDKIIWERLVSKKSHFDDVKEKTHQIIYKAIPFGNGRDYKWRAKAGTYFLRYRIVRDQKNIYESQKITPACRKTQSCNGLLPNALVLHVKQSGISSLAYATELLGVPFVMGPRFISGVGHQTDLGIAADCASLVTYGLRRSGRYIPYVGPKKIQKYLRQAKGPIKEGDILHFGHQVSFFYKDLGVKGSLDGEDLILHSHYDYAEIVSFKKTPYFHDTFKIYSSP